MIERKVFTKFECQICGASEQHEGAVGAVTNFESNHKQCEILRDALVKYMHVGPSGSSQLTECLNRISFSAFSKFKQSDEAKVIEVDYDKFYR